MDLLGPGKAVLFDSIALQIGLDVLDWIALDIVKLCDTVLRGYST